MSEDLFLQTLLPTTHDLGGFKVHRTLPHKARTTIGPFIFFDQMGPARLAPGNGIDVRPHPHINLATVTYLFAGAIDHRDSLGTFQTIEPGAVNLMTAGRGIVHSERSPAAVRPDGPELLRHPDLAGAADGEGGDRSGLRACRPRTICRWRSDRHARARIVMGSLWGETSPVTCHSPTIYADIRLAAGGAMPVDPEAEERGLYVAEGEADARRREAGADRRSTCCGPGRAPPCGPNMAATSCSAAARRSTARATSGGTSSPRAASASARRKRGLEGGPLRAPARR